MKNIQKVLKQATIILKDFSNPKLESEVLLSEVLQKPRIFFKTHPEFLVSEIQEENFFEFLNLRKKNIPVAYILGYKNWGGFKILVDKNTLIPRDETEILCQYILERNNLDKKIKILDVGTGSGCIAVWVKKNFLDADVMALDISKKALNVAQKNAKNNNLKINFLVSDMLEGVLENSFFDIIIANLPYVPENIEVTAEVKQEPHSAIFSRNKGLHHIQKLEKELKRKNIKFNQLWLEFLPQQKQDIQVVFKHYKTELFGDVSGEIFFACISLLKRGNL